MVGIDTVTAQATDHVRELLAGTAHLDDPDGTTLLGYAEQLQTIASTLDVAALRATLADGDLRAVLARDPSGGVLGLRWYASGERSTIHAHSWAIVLVLDGEGIVQRWQPDSAGNVRLTDVAGSRPGDVVAFHDGEAHRQIATDAGMLELVLIGNEHSERVEHTSDEQSADAAELIDRFVTGYRCADAGAVAELVSDDVFVDINVPAWRFQVQGAEVLETILREEEFQPEFELASWRATPMGAGAVIEVECHFTAHSERRMFREVHILHRSANAVDEDVVYCSGHWTAETIARHASEAPMIRR